MNPKTSFWQTVPGILTAIGGTVGSIAALLTALYTIGLIGSKEAPKPSPSSSTPTTYSATTSTSTNNAATSTPLSDSSENSTASRFPDSCLNQKLSVVPGFVETVAIEGGERDAIKGEQSKDRLAGVWLIANSRPVGAITFSPIYVDSENYSFNVEHLLDAKCQETDYVNVSHPEHKPVLHNWDQIRMSFDGRKYWLRIGYNTGSHAITAKFQGKEIR